MYSKGGSIVFLFFYAFLPLTADWILLSTNCRSGQAVFSLDKKILPPLTSGPPFSALGHYLALTCVPYAATPL